MDVSFDLDLIRATCARLTCRPRTDPEGLSETGVEVEVPTARQKHTAEQSINKVR